MAKAKFLSRLELPDMPCECGNTKFMCDDWPTCSECGNQLSDETMKVLVSLYKQWWKEAFDFDIEEIGTM